MLSFLKPKQSGAEIGIELYRRLQNRADGFSKLHDLRTTPAIDNASLRQWGTAARFET